MTQPPTGSAGSPSPRPAGTPTSGAPAGPQHAAPRTGGTGRRPRGRRSLTIASVVLAVTVLLCGAGGFVAFLTLRNAENGRGADEPTLAVDTFLTAVYQDRDPVRAAELVCSAARDQEKIAAKVAEVERYAADYRNPRFRWSPPTLDNRTGDRATVTTRLTMTTSDEKVADQDLRFTVLRTQGWLVCEVG